MISMVGLAVVIYPGLRQPKQFCKPVTSGHMSLKIALKQLRSVTPARFSLEKFIHIQPLSIQSLPSIPSPSGGWTLSIVTQIQLGGINTLSWP
jgi:hypothetical protein